MTRCPKCRLDLELHEDETPTPHGVCLPTQAYYQCPQCRDTFPVYDRHDEGEA